MLSGIIVLALPITVLGNNFVAVTEMYEEETAELTAIRKLDRMLMNRAPLPLITGTRRTWLSWPAKSPPRTDGYASTSCATFCAAHARNALSPISRQC